MRIDILGSITGFIYRVVTTLIALGTDFCRGSTLLTPNLDLVSALSIVANDFSMNDIRVSQRVSSILSNIAQVQSHEDSKTHSVQSVWNGLNSILTNNATGILDFANELTASGLIPPKALTCLNGYAIIDLNSIHRNNPSPANLSIYPYKAKSDAPNSIAENTLRAAVHIPRTFSHKRNKKIPVLLVPGTAVPAAITFYFNFGKLRRALPESELVWVDLPRASLDDIQLSAEYVAYALNYVSALTSSKIAVISWSQGALDIQWALNKWLQGWDANFIQALRSKGGDSAYVPTTTIYSSFDKIVRPMSGENASARLLDSRGVGVSNNHLQTICANNAAGGLYTHEGVLYNPLAWALTVDAFLHDGPSNITRIDTKKICEQVLSPYLELTDLLGTEALLLVALAKILTYSPKVFGEPDIAKYAY
ncbi:hypothetical protein RU639_007949 [Aspergillus parasiticus]